MRDTTTRISGLRRRAALSVLAVAVLLGGPSVAVAMATDADDAASTSITLADAVLSWEINTEVSSGAYNGSCNFLSAGVAGNTKSSRDWTADDGFYKAKVGNASIQKATAKGGWVAPTWKTKCETPEGKAATPATSTDTRVVLSGGTGSVDAAAGTASITWRGSFSVVFYGGMTYWTATNPVLTVAADGTATLTATASGYGASMDGTVPWSKLDATTVTLAKLSGVKVTSSGFSVVPLYRGVAVSGVGQKAKSDMSDPSLWGSFPQNFVDFQVLTGQSTYWFSSGTLGDDRKIPSALTVAFDASDPVVVTPPPTKPENGGKGKTPTNKTTKRPKPTSTPTPTPTPTVTATPTPVPQAAPPAAPPGAVPTVPTGSATGDDIVAQGPLGTTHAITATPTVTAAAPADPQGMTARDAWLLGGALWLGAGAVAIGLPRPGARRR